MGNRTLLWDFDGTLARYPGMWTDAMRRALAALGEADIDPARIDPLLENGFPWHTPAVAHPHLCAPGAWWAALEGLLAAAYVALGFDKDTAARLAREAHAQYVCPARFAVYPDTEAVLARLSARGWRHVIVSNHVPELPDIVRALGLDGHFAGYVNSAETGYEKPHPAMYARALAVAGCAADEAVMIGDNPVADVRGARACGIRGILLHTQPPADIRHAAASIAGVEAVLAAMGYPE